MQNHTYSPTAYNI